MYRRGQVAVHAKHDDMFGSFVIGPERMQFLLSVENCLCLPGICSREHFTSPLIGFQVLRGDFPVKGILGNCPPGYLASRIAAFAADSCCGAFKWQEGGAWGGRAWTRDLPSDTHVLLYLLGAFTAAPFWRFEVCCPGEQC